MSDDKAPTVQSPKEPMAAAKDVPSSSGQQPVLVVTPNQLLAMLSQCGGDYVKTGEMIQGMIESAGCGPGIGSLKEQVGAAEKGKEMDITAKSGESTAGDGTTLEVGKVSAGHSEVEQENEAEVAEDQESDCQVQ